MQQRLVNPELKRREPDKEQINSILEDKQCIKLSEGCPWGCPYCFEDNKLVVFPIPEIKKGFVEIWDMNFLWQPDILKRIKELGKVRCNETVIHYEVVCGLDYRLLTPEIAHALKKSRFQSPRIAWDWYYKDQYKIFDAINLLKSAGYRTGKNTQISCFMIANWKISYEECLKKLVLLNRWGIKVCDCCWDGGYTIAVPAYWTRNQIDDFREKCRRQNNIVNFGIDPEVNK
jgi:hypothetical protein